MKALGRKTAARRDPMVPGPRVETKTFEALVDSSLRIADRVDSDEQSLKGELWLMRGCRWLYKPFRFRLGYHVLEGVLEIVYFQGQRLQPNKGQWFSVRTTDEYRQILKDADIWRRSAP